MTLSDLERLARGGDAGTACDPDTVLALLRVVRAAKDGHASELYDALAALNLKDET